MTNLQLYKLFRFPLISLYTLSFIPYDNFKAMLTSLTVSLLLSISVEDGAVLFLLGGIDLGGVKGA